MANADQLIELFHQAKARPAGAERERFLAEACRDDAALREQIASLLEADADEGESDFLKHTQVLPPVTVLTEKPGDKIGHYKLLQKIGEGGCGVVYLAEQEEPVRRRVAFKVIKLGMDTKQVVARFEAERQALAMMDHANIAKVFEAGATDTGRPYFVMELVRGIKITDYCDQKNLSTAERLDLFIQVCHAIQHAHQKGIIHRDIKPSNILVTQDERTAVPKVIDFGIAKATIGHLTDRTVFTAFEQFIGTPAYMSPEQAEMTSLDIDTRTDIYSLGVLLYELLTGNTPFDAEKLAAFGLDEIRRIIREQEPAKPSTRLTQELAAAGARKLKSSGNGKPGREEEIRAVSRRLVQVKELIPLLRGDLDWIVMRCLEKDRTRRYETANALAMDIERHLNNEPVTACPPSRLYEFQKSVRRHKFGFAAAAGLIIVLGLGVLGSTLQAVRATRAEREQSRLRGQAEAEAAKSLQAARFLQDMLEGVQPSVALGRDTTMLREIVDRTAERVGKDLKGQPAVEAELRSIIGNTYLRLSESPKAEAMHREALRLRKLTFGEANEFVASSLSDLARVLVGADKAPEAELLATNAVALRRNLPGDNKARLGDSLYVLASALQREHKLVAAESIHREALEIRRKLGDHAGVVSSLNNLCLVLRDGGNKVEAEALIREGVLLARQTFGPEHPDVAVTVRTLAVVLRDEGRLDEAAKTAREALEVSTKVAGLSHPATAATAGTLVEILRRQGKLEEVEVLYRDLTSSMQQKSRAAPPGLGGLLIAWGKFLRERGKSAEAERVLREALAAQKSVYGPEHVEVSVVRCLVAGALADQGKLDEAAETAREASNVKGKPFGNEHKAVASLLGDLAVLFKKQGKLAEAETMYREAIALYEDSASGSPNKPDYWRDLARNHNQLGILFRTDGRQQQADIELRRAQELWRLHPDPAVELAKKAVAGQPDLHRWHTLFLTYYNAGDWGNCLWAIKKKQEVAAASSWEWFHEAMAHWQLDNRKEAREWFYKAIGWVDEVQESKLAKLQAEAAALMGLPDPGERAGKASRFVKQADVFQQQGEREKAKETYVQAISLYESLVADFPVVPAYRKKLADLLAKTGRQQEAERVYREALATCRKLLGDEHPDVAATLGDLAVLLRDEGKAAEAEPVAREAAIVLEQLVAKNPARSDYPVQLGHSQWELGQMLNNSKRPKEAEEVFLEALKVFEKGARDFPAEPYFRQEQAFSRRFLAGVADAVGRVDDAERHYRAAIVLYAALAAQVPQNAFYYQEEAFTTWALAGTLERGGRPDAAAVEYRQAIALHEKAIANFPNNAELKSRLVDIFRAQGKLADAEPVLREALARQRKLVGGENNEVANALHKLGDMLRDAGKWTEAEEAFREAAGMRRKLFGNEHLDLGHSLHGLAWVLNHNGRRDEAETLSREELALRRKLLGNDHSEVAYTLEDLAVILRDQGKLSEAETTAREALAIRRKRLGNDHPDVAASLDRLLDLLRAQGEPAEAEALCREEVAMRRRLFGNEHRSVEESLVNLAKELQRQGKLPEAEAAWREELALEKKLSGAEHPWVANSLTSLVRVLQDQGKHAEAEAVYRELLALRRKLPADDTLLAATLAELTTALLAQKKFAEAEPPARECLAIRDQKAPDDWRTFNARSMLGGSLLGQNKYAEAEPILLSGYEGMKQREGKIPANGKVRVKENLQRLVQLYEATGQSEKTVEWNRNLAAFDGAEAGKNTAAPKP